MSRLKVLKHPYVFVVLEFTRVGAHVHGVYINKSEAEGKKLKLKLSGNCHPDTHIAILKKKLQGKSHKILRQFNFDSSDELCLVLEKI